MVAKPNTRMQEATCDQLLLLAVFGDDAMRSRVDAELDRRARLRPFMSAAPPAPSPFASEAFRFRRICLARSWASLAARS